MQHNLFRQPTNNQKQKAAAYLEGRQRVGFMLVDRLLYYSHCITSCFGLPSTVPKRSWQYKDRQPHFDNNSAIVLWSSVCSLPDWELCKEISKLNWIRWKKFQQRKPKLIQMGRLKHFIKGTIETNYQDLPAPNKWLCQLWWRQLGMSLSNRGILDS